MVVPTLPVLGVVPPFELFQTMNWIAIALGYVLLIAAVVSTLVLLKPLLIPILYCIKPSSKTPKQHGLGNCRRCINSLFLLVGRWLCVYTFPALFKMHKTRSDRGSQTREFMVFLDRSVESSVQLIASLVPDPVRRPPFYSPPPRVWKRLHPKPLHGPSLTRTN